MWGTRVKWSDVPCGYFSNENAFLQKTRANMRNEKASSSRTASDPVPHGRTDGPLQRLTSEFGRDPVYSLRYGRWRKLLHCEMLVPKNIIILVAYSHFILHVARCIFFKFSFVTSISRSFSHTIDGDLVDGFAKNGVTKSCGPKPGP